MVSGIYCFKHKVKPFIYIGSSNNIEQRYQQHLTNFVNKQHHNLALQKDFLRDLLTFEILAKGIHKSDLLKFEQEYCVNFLNRGFLLYNATLPRPTNYSNKMLCSKDTFEKYVTDVSHEKTNHIIKWQDDKLIDCFEEIHRLSLENRRLKAQLGYPIRDNIFDELLQEGV